MVACAAGALLAEVGGAAGTEGTRYRLVHSPVAIVEQTSSGPAFQVRVRLNRRPPSDAQGVKMNVLVGRAGSDAPPARYGSRTRYCYVASMGDDVGGGDPALKDVRAGMPVRVTVRIAGQASIVRSVTLRSKAGARRPLAALGC